MKLIKIGKTGRISEANIQAEFYMACKENNINCYLEYHIKFLKSRFDAVIYDDNDNIYAIIEIKSYKYNRLPNFDTKQLKRYRSFGIPVFVVGRLEQIDNIISKIKELKKKSNTE